MGIFAVEKAHVHVASRQNNETSKASNGGLFKHMQSTAAGVSILSDEETRFPTETGMITNPKSARDQQQT